MIEINNKQVEWAALLWAARFAIITSYKKEAQSYEDHTFVGPSPGEAGA